MATIFFCRHHLVRQRLYAGAGLSLPALSFAALVTGFTFSLNLPSTLHTITPVVESLFLVSLPDLWQGLLRWITPDCLFVLLNGIIMILTATSKKSSSCCRNGSSVTESISDNLQNLPYNQDTAGLEQALVSRFYVENAHVLGDVLHMIGPNPEPQLLDAAEDDVQVERFDEAIGDEKEIGFGIIMKEESMQPVKRDFKQNVNVLCRSSSTSSFPSLCRSSRSPSSSSSCSLASCHQSPASLVDDDAAVCEETATVGSVPSVPQHLSPGSLVKKNMRRSRSIVSASFVSSRDEPSDDQLNAEAFKKRIEDFIWKTTSKINHET